MINRKHRFLLGVAILLAIGTVGCSENVDSTNKDQQISLEKEKKIDKDRKMDIVRIGDITNSTSIRCDYKQLEEEVFSFSKSGEKIYRVYVEKGDAVKKGDLLVELDVRGMEDAVSDLDYDLSYQKLILEQIKEERDFELDARKQRHQISLSELSTDELIVAEQNVYKKEIDSLKEVYESRMEDTKDQIAILENRIRTYKTSIAEGRIYAGMDGTISSIKENLQGSISEKDKPIITLIDTSVCAFTSADIEYKEYFDENTPVYITAGFGSSEVQYEAYPLEINSWTDQMVFELSEETLEIEIGTSGTINLDLETSKNTLYLSKKAVHKVNGQYYVYQEDENGIQKVQYVEIGLSSKDSVEILSGLSEGDLVILE